MTRKKILILSSALIVILPFIIYLLLPLADEKYAITENRKLADGKAAYLERIKRTAGPGRRPNIIIIMADDLGKTDISLYGGTAVQTPRMDSLGRDGVTFTEGYCTSPICSPSRAGLLTGRYQQRFGHEVQPHDRYLRNRLEYYATKYFINTGNWVVRPSESVPRAQDIAQQGLPVSEIILAEALTAAGYTTAITGKWHLGYEEPFKPNSRGFGYQYGFYEAFSLYAPIGTPGIVNHRHDYFASKHIWSLERKGTCAIRINDKEIEEKKYLTTRIADEAVSFIKQNRENPFFLYVPFNAPHTPFQAPQEYVDRFAHVKDTNKRVYYAMIAALDDAVGMILDGLKDQRLEEETLVLFASDNGGATYTGATDNAPLRGGKMTNFEGGLNVPCMMRWKGRVRPGQTFKHPVSLMDFFATAMAAANVPVPEDRTIDSVDLMPHVTGKRTAPPHEVLCWRSSNHRAILKGQWKLIFDTRSGSRSLFNLERDKEEKHNIIAEHPQKVAELMKAYSSWEKGVIDPLWPWVMDLHFESEGQEFYFPL